MVKNKVKPNRDELEPEAIPIFQYGEDSGSIEERE